MASAAATNPFLALAVSTGGAETGVRKSKVTDEVEVEEPQGSEQRQRQR